MPKSIKVVPFLQLSEIDFSAPTSPKRLKLSSTANENPTSSFSCKITPPSEDQIQRFFHELSKDKCKSIVLSMTEPFSKEFVCSMDHLPRVLQGIYRPAYTWKKISLNYYQFLRVFLMTG